MILKPDQPTQQTSSQSQQGTPATLTSATLPSPRFLREQLALRLPASRFHHVIGVEGLAVYLAAQWGVDTTKIMYAALFHDFYKAVPKQELQRILAESARFPASEEDMTHPELWHGLVAAQVAMTEYGLDDPDVLSAIAFHTTGTADWNPVGLTLYVADTLEPTRRFTGVEIARRSILAMPMEEAARAAAAIKLQQLESRNLEVHSNTTSMLQWLTALHNLTEEMHLARS